MVTTLIGCLGVLSSALGEASGGCNAEQTGGKTATVPYRPPAAISAEFFEGGYRATARRAMCLFLV
jgi:hypothetical protein